MRVPLSIAAVAVILAFSPNVVMAATKTAKECDAEYAANKDAIKGSGQTKKDFVASCRAGRRRTGQEHGRRQCEDGKGM